MSVRSRPIAFGFICALILLGSVVVFSNEQMSGVRAAERIPIGSSQSTSKTAARPLGGGVTIDSFETAQAMLSLDSPGGVGQTKSSYVSGPGVLGGERDLAVTLIKGGVGSNGVDVQIADGVWSHSQDPTVEAMSEVQWDGADGSMTLNPSGLGVQDLTSGSGQDAIQVEVVFDDLSVDLELRMYTDAANFSRYALTLPGAIFTPIQLVVPYSKFTPAAGAGADFRRIGAATMSIRAASAPDVVIDMVTSVSRIGATCQDNLGVDADGDGVVSPGDTVHYTVVVDNAGDFNGLAVADVIFNLGVDPLTALVNGSVKTSQGTVTTGNTTGDSTIQVALGTLDDGEAATITFDALLTNPFPAGAEQIACQGRVRYETDYEIVTDDPDTPELDDPTITPVIAAPDFRIIKDDNGVSVEPGGTILYTVTYSNVGNQNATGVVLRETVPANTTFNAGASAAGWVCTPNANAGSTCTLPIGPLTGKGGGGNVRFAVQVVNPTPAGVAQIANRACIGDDAANGPDPTPANNCEDEDTPLIGHPDLRIVKDDGGITVEPGGTILYTLTYSNTGNRGASGVILRETVPANTTFNPAASTAGWACTPNASAGSVCTLNIGTLAGGASGSARFTVQAINPAPAGVTGFDNRACVEDDNMNGVDPTPANNCDDEPTPLNAQPDLRIVKDDGGITVEPGGTILYTLTYSNAGNQGATGVVLRETVPANTTFNAAASTAGWACTPNASAGSVCSLNIGALASGASGSARFAVQVINPALAGVTGIDNRACVEDDNTNGADPTPANNCDDEPTPLNAQPDLRIVKDDGGVTVEPGGALVYTLTYSNVGNQGATGVVLRETVPANATFNAAASTAGWVCTPNASAGSACSLNIGALAGGTSGSARFAVQVVNPVLAGVTQLDNLACVEDDNTNGADPTATNVDADPTPGDNCDDEPTPLNAQPDLRIFKSDAGVSVEPGGTVIYTLTYSNVGNQGATGVVLRETVPVYASFNATASTAGWACTPNVNAGSACTLNIGALASGANGSVRFAVNVVSPMPAGGDQVANQVCVQDDGANGADPTPANNCDEDTTPIVAQPDLRLTKQDGGASSQPGSVVVYTLSYANVGTQGATGVVLRETVPDYTTFDAAASTAGWSCAPSGNAGSQCELSVGAVAAGAQGTARFAVRVVASLSAGVSQIANLACVQDDGANGADPTPENNCDTDTTPVNAQPDLRITKSDAGAAIPAGGLIVYTLTYSNAGNQDATGVNLRETVPANTTFEAAASAAGWVCTPTLSAGSNCVLDLGSVSAGASGTALFAVRVIQPLPTGVTKVANTACVYDDGMNGTDPTPDNNCGNRDTPLLLPTPTPTPTATSTPTPTRTPTPTATPTATPGRNYLPLVMKPMPTPVDHPTIIPVPDLMHPKGVAVNPHTNRVYVASRDNDSLMVVDGNSNAFITRIPICREPFGVSVNPATNKIYVACFAQGVVAVINGADNTVKTLIWVGPKPTYVGINENTNQVYTVTYENNALVSIDGATDAVTSVKAMGKGIFGVAVNKTLNQVYITTRDDVSLRVYDAASKHVLQVLDLGSASDSLFGVGVNPVTNKVYVTYSVDASVKRMAVFRASASGLEREATVILPEGGNDAPGDVNVDIATNHIFVANSLSNTVSVIDGLTNTILANVTIPGNPFGVGVNSVTRRAYVGARDANALWVVPDSY